jgi:hypothetical protein
MEDDRRSFCNVRSEQVESGGRQRTRKSTRKVSQVVVRGELSARYAAAFEGMDMEAANGRTVLRGR